MIKKNESQISPRQREERARRLEIEKAIRALEKLKNQSKKEDVVRTVIKDNAVLVRLVEKARTFGDAGNFLLDKEKRSNYTLIKRRPIPASVRIKTVDQSVKDTDRAVLTLRSKPSKEVDEIYKKLAAVILSSE